MSVGINLQPAGSVIPAGYPKDSGATYVARGNGYTYRWNADHSGDTRDRNMASDLASVTTPSARPAITANYVVSTTGSDSASGSSASPFRTVAKAMSMAQAGNVILVKNGTYHESLSLTRSGMAGKPITLMGESTSGVVFDGSGLSSVIVANGAQYITLQNITIRYAANGPQNFQAAVRTGSNWTLQDMVVEKVDGTGICAYGNNVTLQRVTAQDNGVAGIGADGVNGLLVKNCITRRNNNGMVDPIWKTQTTIGGYEAAKLIDGLYYMNPDFEAGGGKYWHTNNATIDGLRANDNVGPGIWFDYQSTNVTIRNCKVHGNRGQDSSHNYQGNGMRFELQDQGPFRVKSNLVYGNSGQAISVEQARNITIRHNTLVGGAVLFRDADRGDEYAIYNISITGNQIKDGFFETREGTWDASSGSTKRITIDGNTYDNGGGQLFYWADTTYSSFSTIRSALGFELNGKRAR
jgi:Right handed beta helix region